MNTQLLELLTNDRLRKKVIDTTRNAYKEAVKYYDDMTDEKKQEYEDNIDNAHNEEFVFWRASLIESGFYEKLDEIKGCFHKYVFQKLGKPYPIMPDEFISLYKKLVSADRSMLSVDPESIYIIFLENIKNEINSEKSYEDLFCTTNLVIDTNKVNDEGLEKRLLDRSQAFPGADPDLIRSMARYKCFHFCLLYEAMRAKGIVFNISNNSIEPDFFLDPQPCYLRYKKYFYEEVESEHHDQWCNEEEGQFWSKNGISIKYTKEISENLEEIEDESAPGIDSSFDVRVRSTKITFKMTGRISHKASEKHEKQLRKLMPCLKTSLDLLNNWYLESGTGSWYVPRKNDNDTKKFFGSPSFDNERLLLTEKDFLNSIEYIKKILEVYFTDPVGKDSLDRRIKNAVCLIIESDGQENISVSLSLCIAAVEALLGEKTSELSEKLSMNIAVLLEPDLEIRDKAFEFVKKLYDKRSRVLHGQQLEDEMELRNNARHLASAVLFAIISRNDFMIRSGYKPEKPSDLLSDLKKSRFKPGQPMGVQGFNIRQLWKYPNAP